MPGQQVTRPAGHLMGASSLLLALVGKHTAMWQGQQGRLELCLCHHQRAEPLRGPCACRQARQQPPDHQQPQPDAQRCSRG